LSLAALLDTCIITCANDIYPLGFSKTYKTAPDCVYFMYGANLSNNK